MFHRYLSLGDMLGLTADYSADAELHKGEFILNNIPELGKIRVIFNNPCTILYVNGEKYISRVTAGEEFDKEKGFLMCFAKAFGLTNSNLRNIVENAIDQQK